MKNKKNVGKIWLFDFCEALACAAGQKAKCQMWDGIPIFNSVISFSY